MSVSVSVVDPVLGRDARRVAVGGKASNLRAIPARDTVAAGRSGSDTRTRTLGLEEELMLLLLRCFC